MILQAWLPRCNKNEAPAAAKPPEPHDAAAFALESFAGGGDSARYAAVGRMAVGPVSKKWAQETSCKY